MNEYFINLIIRHNSPFFYDNREAMQFMELSELSTRKLCHRCNDIMMLKIYKEGEKKLTKLKCRICPYKISLFTGTEFSNIRLELKNFLFLIFCFLINLRNCQVCQLIDIDKKTYIRIKEKLINVICRINENESVNIGGAGIIVQVDETVIVRGKVITNPSNTMDEIRGATWLVGGIEDTAERNFFLEIVENRQSQTLLSLFNRTINTESILRSDGYPSYPSVARALGMEHQIVLHTEGFINEEGQSTNLIENLWAHLKTDLRSRHGVLHSRLNLFIQEFSFRKRHIKLDDRNTVKRAFYLILAEIFNN